MNVRTCLCKRGRKQMTKKLDMYTRVNDSNFELLD